MDDQARRWWQRIELSDVVFVLLVLLVCLLITLELWVPHYGPD
jgi:hypothetical protein